MIMSQTASSTYHDIAELIVSMIAEGASNITQE